MFILAICMSSMEKYLFRSLAHFFGLIVFYIEPYELFVNLIGEHYHFILSHGAVQFPGTTY